MILLSSKGTGYSFEIQKFEVALKKQKEIELKLSKQFQLKVFKVKKAILSKYLIALKKQLNVASSQGDLGQSNEIKETLALLQGEIHRLDSLLKPKVPNRKKTILAPLKSSDFKVHDEEDEFPKLATLLRGKQSFQKGGGYQQNETWTTVPDLLRGRKYLFLTCDESLKTSSIELAPKKSGYVYELVSDLVDGCEILGQVKTSKGRLLYIRKYFIYKELKIATSYNSPTQTSIFIFP
jgi:hypothetical protein